MKRWSLRKIGTNMEGYFLFKKNGRRIERIFKAPVSQEGYVIRRRRLTSSVGG